MYDPHVIYHICGSRSRGSSNSSSSNSDLSTVEVNQPQKHNKRTRSAKKARIEKEAKFCGEGVKGCGWGEYFFFFTLLVTVEKIKDITQNIYLTVALTISHLLYFPPTRCKVAALATIKV